MTEQQDTPRVHPQDPSEGAEESPPSNTPRVHPEAPAEGADDPAVTEEDGG